MKNIKYNILSPDGFSIELNKTYNSIADAKKAFDIWLKRFEAQGYYSANFGRIPLNEVEEYCTLQEL